MGFRKALQKSQSLINALVVIIACILIMAVALAMGTVQHAGQQQRRYPLADPENDANAVRVEERRGPAPTPPPAVPRASIPRWISQDELDEFDIYGGRVATPSRAQERLLKRIIDANGNGITYPTTFTPLTMGASYTCKFVTGQAWAWTSIRLDLYTLAGGERFVASLNSVEASKVINSMTNQGEIPFTITESMGTGSAYFLRISGTDSKTGYPLVLPNSEVFAINNPSSGEWYYPNSQTVLYTGRMVTLNFTVGKPFMSATNVRVEISSAILPKSLVIVNSVNLDFSKPYLTVPWSIPPYFKKSQFYFLRILPNDGPNAATADGSAGTGLSLPSQGFVSDILRHLKKANQTSQSFTLFENSVFNQKELTINTLPSVIATNTSTLIKYSYVGTQKVSKWNIDLFSSGPYSKFLLGVTIGVSTSSSQYNWTVSNDLPAGTYFLRIYGFRDSDTITPDVDPVSRMSDVFTIVNTQQGPNITINGFSAAPWTKGAKANVTFAYKKGDDVSVNGIIIDLYKNT
ncbi:hypothetical protein HDU97_007454, partial [Phlyctochytrium planicorne]